MTDNDGTVVTVGFCRSLTEPTRVANGWPLTSFLYKFAREGDRSSITVEQIMAQYPPEKWPGYYACSICPVCHGHDSECYHCGGSGQVCPRCRGYRWVYGDNGRVQACSLCDALKQQVARQMSAIWRDWGRTGYSWGIAPAERDWTFANGLWHKSESAARIPQIDKLKKLADWLEVWAKKPGYDGYNWVVLLGEYGIGKSYLATCVVHAAVDAGGVAYKWQTADLMNWLRAQQSPQADVEYAQWFRQLQFFPGILVLDEFGHQRTTEFVHETLLTLLSYRGERAGLPTVIVGNMPLQQVRAQVPWLYSRFSLPDVLVPVLEKLPDLRPLLKRG